MSRRKRQKISTIDNIKENKADTGKSVDLKMEEITEISAPQQMNSFVDMCRFPGRKSTV